MELSVAIHARPGSKRSHCLSSPKDFPCIKCRFVPLDCAYSSSRVLFDTLQQLLRSTSGERNLNATCERPGHEQ